MKDDRRGGNFMDFYNRQKSPIYDGRGNVTGYNHGYGERETFDKPVPRDQYTGPGHEMGESRRPRKEIVNRPTRDLGGRRPGGRRGGGRRGGRQRGWWDEPRRSEPSRPTEFSDRLSSDAERMRLLTGEADPQYGRREDYDPQDRQFNRQFDDAPRGRQPWDSDRRGNPLERDPLEGYDYRGGRDVSRPTGRGTRYSGDMGPFQNFPKGDMGPFQNAGDVWDQSSGPEAPRARKRRVEYDPNAPISDIELQRRKTFNEPIPAEYESRLKALENRPIGAVQGGWQEDRIKALENRKPQVTPATQDLSGITGRLSELENKPQTSSWQEDRIAALEGRQPQDLSGITGRLSELEGKAPSWQEDRIKQLEGGRTESRSARDLLDQRLASLENYYKNDPPPPPEESTGNRYEDKQAQYAKQWEVKNPNYDPDRLLSEDYPNAGWGDWTYGTRGEDAWVRGLPELYKRNMRALNREYNKPTYEATIKGRDYKAYGYDDKTRLKMLDQQNIHEDEYLGSGTWTNQWGEKITGQKRGEQPRYFTSHSGLDPQSQEYKDRFRKDQKWISSRPGADYSWRGDDKGYEYRSHYPGSDSQDDPFENEFLHQNRLVKTKGGQDYLWPDNDWS